MSAVIWFWNCKIEVYCLSMFCFNDVYLSFNTKGYTVYFDTAGERKAFWTERWKIRPTVQGKVAPSRQLMLSFLPRDAMLARYLLSSFVCPSQSCPWVGLTHGLGWVEIFQFLMGWVGSTTAKVLKIWTNYFNAFKAQLDKIWLHQAVKFGFTADMTGTGNWSEGVGLIKW